MSKRPSEHRKDTAAWRETEKADRHDPRVAETSRTDTPPNRPPKGGKHRVPGIDPDQEGDTE